LAGLGLADAGLLEKQAPVFGCESQRTTLITDFHRQFVRKGWICGSGNQIIEWGEPD
jgi:hypothetical protein